MQSTTLDSLLVNFTAMSRPLRSAKVATNPGMVEMILVQGGESGGTSVFFGVAKMK